jgi:tetratricopeptide (TPR) repeat protein
MPDRSKIDRQPSLFFRTTQGWLRVHLPGERRILVWVGITWFLLQIFTPHPLWAGPLKTSAGHSGSVLPTSCQASGKPELLRAVAESPSAAAYQELGEFYAEQNNLDCAISAFDLALKLDSRAWETRYSLSLTLLQKGQPAQGGR